MEEGRGSDRRAGRGSSERRASEGSGSCGGKLIEGEGKASKGG